MTKLRRTTQLPRNVAKPKPLGTKELIGLILGTVVFIATLIIDVPNLAEPGERMLAIFLIAIIFWITEPIPLTATAVLVIALEVLLVSTAAPIDPTGGDSTLERYILPYAYAA
ncbi:MAG: anion permease [Actinomycetaceae bacterium]|nr:anion permease [Arcanobacterium sp.]MDD7505304.1 anion permease [Actinomycetaceae bacterium]MDY6143530.1 anion permease [Arcanobacterium sp.]